MIAKAFRLPLLGLVFGLLVGGGIVTAKEMIISEVLNALQDEASKACNCTIKYDSASLSLLARQVVGTNVRLIENGSTRLQFKEVVTSFDLQEVRSKRILLDVSLSDGYSNGFGEKSATFKFIEQLAAPPPPERNRPGRWRVKLMNLYANGASVYSDYKHSNVRGDGATLEMHRAEDDDFRMQAKINQISYTYGLNWPGRSPTKLSIGKVRGSLILRDNFVDFTSVHLEKLSSWIEASGRSLSKKRSAVDATGNLFVNSSTLGIEPLVEGAAQGTLVIGGRLAEPDIQARLTLPPGNALAFKVAKDRTLSFANAEATLHVSTVGDSVSLDVEKFSALDRGRFLTLISPLEIHEDRFDGKIQFEADSFDLKPLLLQGLSATLSLSGTLESPHLALAGNWEQASISGIEIAKTTFSLTSPDLERVEIHASQIHDTTQVLDTTALLTLDPNGALKLERSKIVLNDFPLAATSSNPTLGLRLSGEGSFSGPLSAKEFDGDGSFSLRTSADPSTQPIQGAFKLKQGLLTASADYAATSASAQATIDLNAASASLISVQLNKFDPSAFFPSARCLALGGRADYRFALASPLGGSGRIDLSRLDIGCRNVVAKLERPITLPIRSGTVSLERTTFGGAGGSLTLAGAMTLGKNIDLSAQADVQLHTLTQFLPAADDLLGQLTASLAIKGPILSPEMSGHAELHDGGLIIESAGVNIQNTAGQFDLIPGGLSLKHIAGELNGGTFTIAGKLLPFDFEHSSITLKTSAIEITPEAHTTIVVGGDFELLQPAGSRPIVRGKLAIESGEFRQNVDVINLLRVLSRSLFFSPKNLVSTATTTATALPDIDLDVNIEAPRNILILTQWAGVEINAQLSAKGSFNTPALSGSVESLSGWFIVKDRQFEITSGALHFRPGSFDPIIEVMSETSIRAPTGENTTVFLEVSGAFSNPKVVLSSDRGLSKREILTLLTIGGGARERTLVNRATLPSQDALDSDDEDLSEVSRLFNSLTKIDSITVEPTFNFQTGVLEPTLIARKNLGNRLSLIGQSALTSGATNSTAKLIYNLTPRTNVALIGDASNSQQTTSLGADLTYTVLAEQTKFLNATVHGNHALTTSDILATLRLGDASQVPVGDIEKTTTQLINYYQAESFFDAKVSIDCGGSTDLCHNMDILIEEGPSTLIDSIELHGDFPAFLREIDDLKTVAHNTPATRRYLAKVERNAIRALRNEGFIAARVTGSYEALSSSGYKRLVLQITAGTPASFTFHGNAQFTADEFLETINLFGRRQPFGNNTIRILVENMERMYREAGYLYASMSYEKQISPSSDRVTYAISIREENQVHVRSAIPTGNYTFSEEQLRALVREKSPDKFDDLWRPEYVIEERIEENTRLLSEIYADEGFPDAQVTFKLVATEDPNSLVLNYEIVEGTPLYAQELRIEGFPDSGQAPDMPSAPYSIPRVNHYLQEVIDSLQALGYLSTEVNSDFETSPARVLIHVRPGPLTYIGDIILEGNTTVPDEVIHKALHLESGEAWETAKLETTRRDLFALGLFARVRLVPSSGRFTNPVEDLTVQVVEKPQQTLEVGFGANSQYGLHAFGEGVDRSLFNDGRTFSLRLDTYYDRVAANISQGIASLRYSDPVIFGNSYLWNEDLRFQKLDISTQEFNLNRVSLASYITKAWDNGTTASFGHTISQEILDNVSPGAIISDLDEGIVRLSFLSGTINFDRRDSPLNPLRGYNLHFDYRLASRDFGSDGDYGGVSGKASVLLPLSFLGPRWSTAASTSGGCTWVFGQTSEVPISQRYYLGGQNTVRGFRENSLGPRGSDDAVIGGDVFLADSLELRYLATSNVSLHIFTDAGNVFLRSASSGYTDLRFSGGVGMRYLSPIGPIGIDLGHPLDRKQGESALRVDFEIGTNF